MSDTPDILERPHKDKKIQELVAQSIHDWNDSSALYQIYTELTCRKSKKCVEDLKERISLRKAEMFFDWPITNAEGGDGTLSGSQWHEQGLLGHMGYHVGDSGESMGQRRLILDHAYEKELPKINGPNYMMEWGQPLSAMRLKKIAESLAAFCRNQKRKSSHNVSAVADWEADLAYLKWKYYDNQYGFVWPGPVDCHVGQIVAKSN